MLHTLRFAHSQLMLSTEQGALLLQRLTGTPRERAQALLDIRKRLRVFVEGVRRDERQPLSPEN